MIRSLFCIVLSLLAAVSMTAQVDTAHHVTPPLVHPLVGESVTSSDGQFTLTLVQKKQNFTSSLERDPDIYSPKSVNIHPNGRKYYVNSLEGAKTVVYDFRTQEKLTVIRHRFTEADSLLWAPASGLWPFTHYDTHLNTFVGKPVESTFSHGGRYLWVPYYRRSYDINAQDPSAVAVIDTRTDSIIRLFETGPLPKMIATSPDGRFIAISHWGNNTVGLLDISSPSPQDWHYTRKLVVDYELQLDYSLTEPVNRDVNSGYALRGTVFTPDGRYLLIGCMGGAGGIAVIDLQTQRYLGRVMGMMPNVRHLAIHGNWLYLSINRGGYVQRIPLQRLLQAIPMLNGKTYRLQGWENCKVGAGARTLALFGDGRYIFVACNTVSQLYVVDARSFSVVAQIAVDSYPVGLDVSQDGRYIFVTSQGRDDHGGNAVNVYELTRTRERAR